jgi:hypothetical protein
MRASAKRKRLYLYRRRREHRVRHYGLGGEFKILSGVQYRDRLLLEAIMYLIAESERF